MIDPANPPQIPEATQAELEEFLMFGIAAAGHNSKQTAVALDRCIELLPGQKHLGLPSPLARLAGWLAQECYRLPCDATGWDGGWSRKTQVEMLGKLARQAGLGCYNQRVTSYLDFLDKINTGLNLRTCSIAELEQIYGVGKKTSRFFVMYTRPDQNEYAILDVHILAWLREQGYDAPTQTPRGPKSYEWLESMFVQEASSRGVTPLELDRAIWTARRKQ